MADVLGVPATTRLILFLAIWNIHGYKTQRCDIDQISGEIEKFTLPSITSQFLNVSSIAAPMPPTVPHSHTKRSLNPLKIKSMSTNIKTVSVPSTRKRRFAPLLPPLLPPLIPPLPFLPLPILPLIPPPPILTLVPKIVNPIKSIQKLKRKTALQKTLKSIGKEKAVKLPRLDSKKNILDKLLDLKRKGSLTTAEFIRFKKLLLH